jgi:AcrR family transcriptional regulator
MGRPTTPLLSTRRIATTAMALVDKTGEFTIGQVAGALGVRPSSLYNHVSGKSEIVEAMRSMVFEAVPSSSPAPGVPWNQQVRALLRSYRDAFAARPRLVPLLTAQTVSAPDVMRIYDDIARILSTAGLPATRLLDVITVLDSFVIGSALDLVAPDEVWDAEQAHSVELQDAIRSADVGRARADRAFELGLNLLLDGLTQLTD